MTTLIILLGLAAVVGAAVVGIWGLLRALLQRSGDWGYESEGEWR